MLTKEQRAEIEAKAILDAFEDAKGALIEQSDLASIHITRLVNAIYDWKNRALALERALQSFAPCETCVRERHDCEGCEHWIQVPGEDHWEFDEARFSTEVEG